MTRRVLVLAAVLMLVSAGSAMAQRAQVTIFGGWTFSDGVSGDPVRALDGNLYDGVDIKDAFNWGFSFGGYVTDNFEVGFRYGQQLSTLAITGSTTRELGDLTVHTYHPYFQFNAGDRDAKIRPFVMFGLGATQYPELTFTRAAGGTATTEGNTQFSTSFGAGVNIYPTPRAGLHLGLQWTPTYIKSDASGWWCDPYWGCYVVGDAQYSNQFSFNGGVTFRF